jgi:hypothetical protein
MKIPSTKGLGRDFRQVNKTVRNRQRGTTAELEALAETLIKSQSTLNPASSGLGHKREYQNSIAGFII